MSYGEGVIWRKKSREMDRTQSQSLAAEYKVAENKTRDGGDGGEQKRAKRYSLVSYWELPEYMKDNEYILNYYRANWPLTQAFFSAFRLHNETLNVWTHLMGFVLFVVLTMGNAMHVAEVADLFGLFNSSFPSSGDRNVSHGSINLLRGTSSFVDPKQVTLSAFASAAVKEAPRWPFFVFLSGSMFCLLSSSTCHLFSCHSHSLNLLLLRLDYVGITVMIITSFFPPIYYIFQCEHAHWRLVYLGGITVLGLLTVVTLLSPKLSTGKYRGFRALLFCSMGLFGIFPAVHALVANWDNPQRNITLAYESAMALFYLTGTVFYVTRVPERWKPGWFDLAGHSHQIFHVFVVMGALAHYGAALIFLQWRDAMGCDDNL